MPPLKTILLVDDELDVREVVVAVLSEPGYTVLTAANGYEAMRILVRGQVDLLLTDIKLPGVDGFDLACQATRMRPNLRVLYLSGRDSYVDRYAGPTYGRLMRKPVRASDLLREVESCFG